MRKRYADKVIDMEVPQTLKDMKMTLIGRKNCRDALKEWIAYLENDINLFKACDGNEFHVARCESQIAFIRVLANIEDTKGDEKI